MTFGTLLDLKFAITSGEPFYACRERDGRNWHVGPSLKEASRRALAAARALNYPVTIYQIVDPTQADSDDQYLFVLKLLEPGPHGESNCDWAVAGSREVAERLRDISAGPSPYFGLLVTNRVDPES